MLTGLTIRLISESSQTSRNCDLVRCGASYTAAAISSTLVRLKGIEMSPRLQAASRATRSLWEHPTPLSTWSNTLESKYAIVGACIYSQREQLVSRTQVPQRVLDSSRSKHRYREQWY